MSGPTAVSAEYPPAPAFHLARNAMVQGLGLSMVVVVGLGLLSWPIVLAWTTAAVVALAAEIGLRRRSARSGVSSPAARIAAPAMRLLITSLYAMAAFAFLTEGGLGEHLFAFALISASVVNVLMRHYRSPAFLLFSLSPYLIVLVLVGQQLTLGALAQDDPLRALAPTLTVALFALQIWKARAQLSEAWNDLITARDAAQVRERAAQAANVTKSQFLTTMSHELRTPLHGVLGMAQALRNDALTPVQSRRVGVILQQGESLLGMLNDLLDLSRIEAGALELELTDFDLEHLARGVAAAYEPRAARKGLTFEFKITDTARGRYRGDAARIRRILYSLADNAVKFTAAGRVALLVDRAGGALVFVVEDTGIGIGEQDRRRLFEGFFQADATLGRQYDGAGIGLAICGQLTALMGGEIDVGSSLGKGSTFTLRVPLRKVDTQAQQTIKTEPPTDGRRRPLRVLAAEDNLINQMVLRTFLEPAGIEATIVENGRQALEAWEQADWDLVLMDIQMPEMNGIEATLAIRQREQLTGRAHTPILAVTASAMTHQLEAFEAAGMDGVVPKPVNLTNLLRMIEKTLPSEAAERARVCARSGG